MYARVIFGKTLTQNENVVTSFRLKANSWLTLILHSELGFAVYTG